MTLVALMAAFPTGWKPGFPAARIAAATVAASSFARFRMPTSH